MKKGLKFISDTAFLNMPEALKKDYAVYIPVKKQEKIFYKEYIDKEADTENMTIDEVRPFEPLKPFFFMARERVADGFNSVMPVSGNKPFAIFGVKACDLKGFKVQDYVFNDHDYTDPFYAKARQSNLIISADCSCAISSCFCLALEVTPYPKADFDINLSKIEGGFVVEAGSEKGEAFIDTYSYLFQDAGEEQLSEREKMRAKVAGEVESNIKENNIPHQKYYEGAMEKNYDSDIWKREAETCVECGACNTICPTCHCFLLYDQKDEDKMERLRVWDSCLIKDFALVAGGHNPRKQLWMRLRNRFDKKFAFFPKVLGLYACTGCGRCIMACPGKIDIRKILGRLTADEQ